MIKKVAHLADIHIRKNPARKNEYKAQFDKTIESLKEKQPDRIVIVGDLFHDYISLESESIHLASYLLNELSKIAKTIVTQGNHDRLADSNRMDSIEAIVSSLNNPNVVYYNKNGLYEDENVVWVVWHHSDKQSPYPNNFVKDKTKKYIDLFHDPINGCETDTNQKLESEHYRNLNEFKGDLVLMGHIHKRQFFK